MAVLVGVADAQMSAVGQLDAWICRKKSSTASSAQAMGLPLKLSFSISARVG